MKKTKKNAYTILQLNRPKVNAINHQMVKELQQTFSDLEADDTVHGVILTGTPHFFSAGLDVIELYDYDEPKMRAFMIDFGALHVQMARFAKPLICAINGHSPAGGTVFAITADHRIMVEGEKYGIGLNEVAVNVQISHNLAFAYAFWLGNRKAHQFTMDGKLLSPTEALASGLVDEVVTAEELLPRAEAKMQQYLQANPDILRNTKNRVRKVWWNQLETHGEADLEAALEVWWSADVRGRMKRLIDKISRKK
ncbi:MAG: 3,2-trans-enoyl-CoA isomerase [Saprospiraceae bacterium]